MDAETLREAVELSNHVIQQIDGHLKDIDVIDGIIQSLDAVSQPQDVPVFFLNTKPRGFLNAFPHKQNYIHKYLHIHEIYISIIYVCTHGGRGENTSYSDINLSCPGWRFPALCIASLHAHWAGSLSHRCRHFFRWWDGGLPVRGWK